MGIVLPDQVVVDRVIGFGAVHEGDGRHDQLGLRPQDGRDVLPLDMQVLYGGRRG